MSEPSAVVTARGAERICGGHLWIYRSDVSSTRAAPGEVVRVTNPRGRFLGRAFWSDKSEIALRFLTRHDEPVDRAFFERRLLQAAAYRSRVVENTECCRLVHAEADLLPSLIVDRYGDCLVIQTLSQGSEKRKAELVEILIQQLAPRGVLERNDPKARLLEGLPQSVAVLHGEIPEPLVARINGISFRLDLRGGQKTGAFLDQRENYQAAARYAHGEVLDCFCYQGGFGLHLASRGQAVEALDSSPEALEAAKANADLNGIRNITFREGNVFDILKEYDHARRRFDTIVLDPPAFAKSRSALPAASRGYKEINLRSLRMLRPGGTLITCSCSYHLSEVKFGELLWEAAVDSDKQMRVVERRGQAMDHPILLTVPETSYLKCIIMSSLE